MRFKPLPASPVVLDKIVNEAYSYINHHTPLDRAAARSHASTIEGPPPPDAFGADLDSQYMAWDVAATWALSRLGDAREQEQIAHEISRTLPAILLIWDYVDWPFVWDLSEGGHSKDAPPSWMAAHEEWFAGIAHEVDQGVQSGVGVYSELVAQLHGDAIQAIEEQARREARSLLSSEEKKVSDWLPAALKPLRVEFSAFVRDDLSLQHVLVCSTNQKHPKLHEDLCLYAGQQVWPVIFRASDRDRSGFFSHCYLGDPSPEGNRVMRRFRDVASACMSALQMAPSWCYGRTDQEVFVNGNKAEAWMRIVHQIHWDWRKYPGFRLRDCRYIWDQFGTVDFGASAWPPNALRDFDLAERSRQDVPRDYFASALPDTDAFQACIAVIDVIIGLCNSAREEQQWAATPSPEPAAVEVESGAEMKKPATQASSRTWKDRVRVDDPSNTITIDGKNWLFSDKEEFLFVKLLAEKEGAIVTRDVWSKLFQGERIDQRLRDNHSEFKSLYIKSKTGNRGGYWMILPHKE